MLLSLDVLLSGLKDTCSVPVVKPMPAQHEVQAPNPPAKTQPPLVVADPIVQHTVPAPAPPPPPALACSAFKSPNIRTISLQHNVSYAGLSAINHIWSQPNAPHANLSTRAESSESFVCYHVVWSIHDQASQGRSHVGGWICLLYRRFIDTS
jgi:hypothetical protein